MSTSFHRPSPGLIGVTLTNRLTVVDYNQYERALTILLALLVVQAAGVLLAGLTQPISDIHGFRQNQTAITAYWLWRGGPWLAYETPVLGAPWSLPLELPVYQGLVALLRTIGVPIIIGGRIISFLFFVGLLWPLAVLFRSLRLNRTSYLTVAVLLFASPIYVFWSRTVMIESCALFFGLAWLAAISRLLIRPGWWILIMTIAVGVLGINVKSTTFAPFGLLGVALVARHVLPTWRQGPKWSHLMVLAACAIPFLSGVAWVAWSDQVKLTNPLAASLTSDALVTWTLGTMAQRIDPRFWMEIVARRILPHIFGFMTGVALLVICASFAFRRFRLLGLFALLGFLTSLLTFTNLHIVHNYYQYANACFLIAAVGFGIMSLAERGRHGMAVLALTVLVGSQAAFFWIGTAPTITMDQSHDQSIVTAAAVRRLTKPDEAVLVFNSDWSSEIGFYSERRTLMVPYWAGVKTIERILRDPRSAMGSFELGAVVYCADDLRYYQHGRDEIQNFVARLPVLADEVGCRVLAPKS